MNQKHPQNKNIDLHYGDTFNNLPLLPNTGPYCLQYLAGIQKTLDLALAEHPRTVAFRVDLRYPEVWNRGHDGGVISRFMGSMKSQITADLKRKAKKGGRLYRCNPRIVWAKEQSGKDGWHYHAVILLNKDAYLRLGGFASPLGNTVNRIRKAWAGALGVPEVFAEGSVSIPDNATYYPEPPSSQERPQYEELFKRLSYFAKQRTKVYGGHGRSFGCSTK